MEHRTPLAPERSQECPPIRTGPANPARGWFATVLLAGVMLSLCGCAKSDPLEGDGAPLPPKQAASQLDQAFAAAPADLKSTANAASDALNRADFSQAVQTLVTMQQRQNLTLDQGIAVHQSIVSLEARLVRGVEAGDPNAIRAFEQLKRLRRH